MSLVKNYPSRARRPSIDQAQWYAC